MKKNIFNVIFYLICFSVLFKSIYRLAFTVPPAPGTPGYQEYYYGTIVMSIGIGLMVIVPNLIIEYLMGNWSS
ncbi:hypothetical protein [Lacrimispora sp.]|jgi:hypothetical protein|uniref:hypothetical protein n=1 Tax=Lacrimispora sp. TaxID=2719234 RepID=UPI00045239C4|nr:hypothetical protein [Lacrimispora sp.]EXG87369.1 hypothetical protein K413DRAFT_4248 [Clostridium sp. ASBs410]MDR7810957.1 hypothetical protein [Lacrimispora sp.]